MATISQLQSQVLGRVEENVEDGPIFWQLETEINSALQEAQCELALLVGRPLAIANVPLTIQPNTPFQTLPAGMFILLSMQGPASEVWKITLEDMDYAQVSDSGWQQDIGDSILRWGPLGFNQFFVWPSVPEPQTVLATGILSPIAGVWPYDGTQTVQFDDENFVTLEKYAASYLRFKEASSEWSEGVKLYEDFLQDAKRLTQIQDRIDPFLFEGATGGKLVSNPTTQR